LDGAQPPDEQVHASEAGDLIFSFFARKRSVAGQHQVATAMDIRFSPS
jgi:hypothetical protein